MHSANSQPGLAFLQLIFHFTVFFMNKGVKVFRILSLSGLGDTSIKKHRHIFLNAIWNLVSLISVILKVALKANSQIFSNSPIPLLVYMKCRNR